MLVQDDLDEFRSALRADVCSHCIERWPNAPPCAPLGKECGIELHLAELVDICRHTDSALIDPYIDQLHDAICPACTNRQSANCPCPLSYLLQLAVETIEKVDAA